MQNLVEMMHEQLDEFVDKYELAEASGDAQLMEYYQGKIAEMEQRFERLKQEEV